MPNYDEPEDRFADLRAQLAAANAQRDELLRAAVKVCNTSPRTSSSNERELDHYDACTELGIVIERIARAQSGQPCRECDGEGIIEKCDWPGEHANRYQEPCPSCKPQSGQPAQRDDDGTESGGGVS